jgi:hypothetical protein
MFWLIVAALTIWAAAALFLDLPFGKANLFGVFIYIAAVAGIIALVPDHRLRALVCLLCFAVVCFPCGARVSVAAGLRDAIAIASRMPTNTSASTDSRS